MKLLRKIRCLMRSCPCKQMSDDTGCWAECVDCGKGKETTFVDHRILRSYSDLMDAHRRHNELVDQIDTEQANTEIEGEKGE